MKFANLHHTINHLHILLQQFHTSFKTHIQCINCELIFCAFYCILQNIKNVCEHKPAYVYKRNFYGFNSITDNVKF